MFSPSFLLLAIALGSSAAQAFTTVSLKKTQGKSSQTEQYLKGAPAAARARVALQKSRSGPASIPATNLEFQQYTAPIGVGNPPTYYNVIIDTGSSNTAVGTGKSYVQTNTSIPTGQTLNVTYGEGFIAGKEFLDQITIAPGFVIKNQSIGDATQFADFDYVDGILGIGPVGLTELTIVGSPQTQIPTVPDNALSQGLTSTEVIGIYFAPTTSANDTNGELTFGGFDYSKFTGPLRYTPVTKTSPSSLYWGVNITKATYGTDVTVIPSSCAGIVDTGTTLIILASDFFHTYMSAIPGSSYDNKTELLAIPESSVGSMLPLNFIIGDAVYSLTPEAQLIPESENVAYGGVLGVRYSYVTPAGGPSGFGFDFTLGQKFLERYYSVYDTDKQQIGFAETIYTFA